MWTLEGRQNPVVEVEDSPSATSLNEAQRKFKSVEKVENSKRDLSDIAMEDLRGWAE